MFNNMIAHYNPLGGAILMSTYNIAFYEELSKIIPNSLSNTPDDTYLTCFSSTNERVMIAMVANTIIAG